MIFDDFTKSLQSLHPGHHHHSLNLRNLCLTFLHDFSDSSIKALNNIKTIKKLKEHEIKPTSYSHPPWLKVGPCVCSTLANISPPDPEVWLAPPRAWTVHAQLPLALPPPLPAPWLVVPPPVWAEVWINCIKVLTLPVLAKCWHLFTSCYQLQNIFKWLLIQRTRLTTSGLHNIINKIILWNILLC